MDLYENEKVEKNFFRNHQVRTPDLWVLRYMQKVPMNTTGFEPVTLRVRVTSVTARPTNVDIGSLSAHAFLIKLREHFFSWVETGVRLAVFSQLSEECNSLYFRAVFLYTRRI